MKRKQYLFCPGPVHVAVNTKKAATTDICHREEEFSNLLSELHANLLSLFEIKNNGKYHPIVITGSSTAGNESVLSTAAADKRVLVISNGEFGDRLNKISRLYAKKTYVYEAGWTNEIDLSQVEELIKKHGIELIAMVHHETSTGLLNPVKEVGKIAHKYGALFFVDAVSSIGADALDIEGSHISFLTTASGKAIGSFPGTAIVLGKVSEFEKLKDIPQRTMYLHLYNHYHYSKDLLQTPNTPNAPGFFALNQAVKNILKVGVAKRRAKLHSFATYIRQELKKMDLTFCVDEQKMSNVLTTIYSPSFITPNEIQAQLRAKNIIIYAGKGPLAGGVFQISNIGEIKKKDIVYMLRALGEILKKENKLTPVKSTAKLRSVSSRLMIRTIRTPLIHA